VDLFEFVEALMAIKPRGPNRWPMTDDGIHLSQRGYWDAAVLIGDRLGQELAIRVRGLHFDGSGEISASERTHVSRVEKTARGFRFTMVDDVLLPPFPESPGRASNGSRKGASVIAPWRLRIMGLAPGRYELKVDGQTAATADADGWAESVELRHCPEFDQVETLRTTITRKNELFFYRWRPQNVTYLFGFRKHEQGNNAVEIPQFDPLVAEKEQEIARLRKPIPHQYELNRISQ
jgi:hypothetical protein